MAGGRFVQRELRERVLPRPRVFVDRTNPLETLNEDEVFRRFRFRPRTIIFIVGLIENVVTHRTKRSLALPPLLQVLVTLRFLATGAFQQLIGDSLNRISQPTISRIVRRVTRALTSLVKDFIKFPTGRAATTVKQEFGSIAGFPNVLGCVDGTFIRIKRPTQNEADFLNRKGYHSLNVQAICDAHMRITSFNASWPGSVHDSRIWNSSALKDQFENGVHDGLLLGDSGYACRRYMMTPYLHPADRSQERFNSSLCRTRVRVEQTFGVLKARFPCLRFGLRMAPECAVTVTSACIILHNIGILRSDILDVEIDNNNQLHIQDQGVLAQPDGKHVRNHIARQYF
ncbi:putative nuclease HARBI1 [Argopecten irradians]|uniref:putative nuclease HARBI1 n=1 Tax=Argopecten irradians TaxID=31199 RepID=UPI00371204E6